jgi:hypothetical protein
MKLWITLFFIFLNSAFGQELIFLKSLGNFSNASSFDVDLNGNIFISDVVKNSIVKFDSNGTELNSIGGYGWHESTFDEPTSIFTNTLSVYVSDKNNNRIQRFDKDLNFLSQLSGNDENIQVEFAYPTCIGTSSIGDLFILDSDNKTILKFNLTGQFIMEIGGNDAGGFSLSNPQNFSIDENGNIFVLDNDWIKAFDQYGNGLFNYQPNILVNKIYAHQNKLVYIENNKLTFFSLADRKVEKTFEAFAELENNAIVQIKIVKNTLYLLLQAKVLKYKIN